jgi:Na+-translocating ferredoxin:NAD+ oxidoreductase subunit B
VTPTPAPTLAEQLLDALPQTQCTRCGFPDCQAYAEAMASGTAAINQCPPGGAEGVARLAAITGQPAVPLNPQNGTEGPLRRALIDEAWCIGCTLCIKACPVDCIVGGPKLMHTVITDQCTGCELCLPVCPVDCITMIDVRPGLTGWAAWSAPEADTARKRYAFHQFRVERDASEQSQRLAAKAQAHPSDVAGAGATSPLTEPDELQAKRAVIEAALARSRQARDKP